MYVVLAILVACTISFILLVMKEMNKANSIPGYNETMDRIDRELDGPQEKENN